MLAPAGVLADGIAAANAGTQVTSAPNGVPVVNIAIPNGAGLSHNRYNSFSVESKGAVLNNAAGQSFVQTQLAGQVLGNINLPKSATVILNEVVSGNRSALAGFLEVAGPKADVIVANPNGITCNGCGFINTPRITMTTGTPMLDASGGLQGFRVTGGDVSIAGAGLDARNQNYLDIVARSVKLDAQVNAQQLNITTGNNDWDYTTRDVTTHSASGDTPTRAFDSTLLGGMYANRIRILATESGVGVRMRGDAAASADDFRLSASGKIELQGKISSSQGALSVVHNGPGSDGAGAIALGSGGSLSAGGNLTLTTSSSGAGIVLTDGTLTAGGDLDIRSAGALADSASSSGATRFAAGKLSVRATGGATMDNTGWGAGGASSFEVGSVQVGAAGANFYSGSDRAKADRSLTLTAVSGSLDLGSATLQSANAIQLSAYSGLANSGSVKATGDLAIRSTNDSGKLVITNSGLLQAGAALSIAGYPAGGSANHAVDVTNTSGGQIVSGAVLDVSGNVLTNAGRILAGSALKLSTTRIANSGTLQGASALMLSTEALTNTTSGVILTSGVGGANVAVTAASLSNAGTLQSAGALSATVSGDLTNTASGKILTRSTADGGSSGAITLAANTVFNAGMIGSSGTADVTADAVLTNSGTLQSTGAATFSAGTTLSNHAAGKIIGAAAVVLGSAHANFVLDNDGRIEAGSALTLGTSGHVANFTNTGAAFGTTLSVQGGKLVNQGTLQATDGASIIGATLDNRQNASILTSTTGRGAGTIQLTGAANNLGMIDGKGTLALTAASFGNGSSSLGAGVGISSQTGLTLDTGTGDMDNYGAIYSAHDAALSAGNFHNHAVSGTVAKVYTGGNMTLAFGTGKTLTNNGRIEAAGALSIGAAGHIANLSNNGNMLANTLSLQGGNVDNQGTLQAANGANIHASQLNNGAVGHDQAAILTSTTGNGAGTITLSGAATNYGAIHGSGALTLNAASVNNTNTGGISSLTALTLATSGDINNRGALYSAADMSVSAANFRNLGAIGASDGEVYAGGNMVFNLSGGSFENSNSVNAGGDITISARDFKNQPVGGVPNVLTGPLVAVNPDANGVPTGTLIAASGGFHCNTVTHDDCAYNYIYQYSYTSNQYLDGPVPQQQGLIAAGNIRPDGVFQLSYSNSALNQASVISAPTIKIIGTGAQAFVNTTLDLYQNSVSYRYRRRENGDGNYVPLTALDYSQLDTIGNYDNNWASIISAQPDTCILGFCFPTAPTQPEIWNAIRNSYGSAGAPVLLPAPGLSAGLFAAGPLVIQGAGVRNAGVTQTLPNGATKGSHGGDPGNTGTPQPGSGGTHVQGQQASANGIAALSFANGIGIVGLSLSLPTNPNGIFVASKDAKAQYLVETNPRFGPGSPFGGSDYLEQLLGFNPEQQLKRLGDDNYEAKLIRDQLVAQTGNIILTAFSNEVDQMKGLMESSAAQAGALGLKFGTALTEQQIAGLKGDIVWMVEETVAGQKVLAPVVYLSHATQNAVLTGAVIAARDISITGGQSLTNTGGTIAAQRNLTVNLTGDITNTSGTIKAANVDLTSTQGSIRNETSAVMYGDDAVGQTQIGKQATISASNHLKLDAAQDITVKGAEVKAGNDAAIRAGGNVVVDTVENRTGTSTASASSGFLSSSSNTTNLVTVRQQASSIDVGNGLTVSSGKDITIAGSNVTAGGNASLDAKGDLNILARTDSTTTTTRTSDSGFGVGGGLGGTSVTTTVDTQKTNVASTISVGGNAQLAAGKTLNVVGSDVAAKGNLDLKAANINVLAGENSQETKRRTETTSLNLTADASADHVGVGANVQLQTTDTYDLSTQARGSTLKSGGNITRTATNTITDRGTAIDAGGNLTQSANSIQSLATADTKLSTSSTSTTTIGYGVGANLGLGQAYQGDKSAVQNGDPTQIAQPNINVGVDITYNRTNANAASADSKAVVSTIRTGGSVNSTSKEATVLQGTAIDAGKDVNLKAGDLQVTAARDTHTESSDKQTIDAKLSVTYNGSVGGSVSGGYGTADAKADSSNAVVGSIKSGGNLTIDATRDVKLEGTQLASGGSTTIAGNNVSLEAAKSTASSSSTSMDVSASISVTKGTGKSSGDKSGGVEASYSESSAKNASSTSTASSVAAGGNVTITARTGDLKLEGTDVAAGKDVTLAAKNNLDFSAAVDTASSSGSKLSIGGSMSGGKSKNEDGTDNTSHSGGVQFASGNSSSSSETRTGGTVRAGGALAVASGGNTRLEGTQVQADSAKLDVGGNLKMESAVSTSSSKSSNVGVGISASSDSLSRQKPGIKPPTKEGPASAYGSVDVGSSSRDTRTNQNTSIQVGKLDARVGGDAAMAGVDVKARQQNVAVKGNTTVEARTDADSGSSSSVKLRGGYVSQPGDKKTGESEKAAGAAPVKAAAKKAAAKTAKKPGAVKPTAKSNAPHTDAVAGTGGAAAKP